MTQIARPSTASAVLYVEDQPINVAVMTMLFERLAGPSLIVATDGQEALRVAAEIQPQLLLLDLRLPDCYGTELLKQLRDLPGYAQISAVAVTAEHDFQLEGTDFIEVWRKPLRVAFVMGRLAQLCGMPVDTCLSEAPPVRRSSASAWTGA